MGRRKAGSVPLPPDPDGRAGEITPIRIGGLIKERRKKKKLTQQMFADMMGVPHSTVANWEADRCKPDYELLPALCAILDIKLFELFRTEPEAPLSEMENQLLAAYRRMHRHTQWAFERIVEAMLEEQEREKDGETDPDGGGDAPSGGGETDSGGLRMPGEDGCCSPGSSDPDDPEPQAADSDSAASGPYSSGSPS